MSKQIRLSPTTGFSLFKDCPHCLWLHYNAKLQRPRGIFPSLPGGMDRILKIYFDKYRGKLPPELRRKVKGKLMPDVDLMNRWRNWRTGLTFEDKKLNALLFGALDECLVDGDVYIALDYKTRGSAPKDGDSERYYQSQLDTYTLLLKENGYKTGKLGYLAYYYPDCVENKGMIKFNIKVVEMDVNAERARMMMIDTVKILRGSKPEPSPECEYCSFINARKKDDSIKREYRCPEHGEYLIKKPIFWGDPGPTFDDEKYILGGDVVIGNPDVPKNAYECLEGGEYYIKSKSGKLISWKPPYME
jgi:hypothetical protein